MIANRRVGVGLMLLPAFAPYLSAQQTAPTPDQHLLHRRGRLGHGRDRRVLLSFSSRQEAPAPAWRGWAGQP